MKVVEGPFVGDGGTVDALISETRIRALIFLFYRATPVELNYRQVIPKR